MKRSTNHWFHAALTLLLSVFAGGVLLPLVRVQPKSVHDFMLGLDDWLRIGFIFFLCVLFAVTMFKLLSPKVSHLRHCKSHPPTWLAAVVGLIIVAATDIAGGLDSDGYQATVCEWLGYAGGSMLFVGWYCGTWQESATWFRLVATKWFRSQETPQVEEKQRLKLQNIPNAPWEEIEEWLLSDAAADYDFLGNRAVAERLAAMLLNGTRSIGIVAPFGAGKTSLVNWMIDAVGRNKPPSRQFFVCHHSCWGFEKSASAIHDMLAAAVAQIGVEVDTFQFDSLPDSYRQTFSAGGDWIDSISKLVLKTPDPLKQFERLSHLLGDLKVKVVFIVEDLDRNDTRSFEIQEVLAFLERLKPYRNFSFVLTAGLSSSRKIDFSKLCDHIEHLRSIHSQHSSALVLRLRERCLDSKVFFHERLTDTDRKYDWHPLVGLMMSDREELSFPQAVASLLNTPRSLRHALGRTFSAWKILYGEIDFDHLLAVNVLRFGAPECFLFLVRRWDRLRASLTQNDRFSRERVDRIRQAVINDWNKTIRNVEWNTNAAMKVMEFILPATEYWLVDKSRSGYRGEAVQGGTHERYWLRTINEAIEETDIRDQRIITELKEWIASPSVDSRLVTSLRTSEPFCILFRDIACQFFNGQADQILLLCQQVLTRICEEDRATASYCSQGFETTWFLADRYISLRAENATWLQERISDAAAVSLELVLGLWNLWSTGRAIVRNEDRHLVRQHVLDALRREIVGADALIERLSPQATATLYQLVFDIGNKDNLTLADAASWSWLGPVLLEAVRKRDVVAAANCGVLLAARFSGREQTLVDYEVLDRFFGHDAVEVIQILKSMEGQLPESDRSLVRNAVEAASRSFEESSSLKTRRRQIEPLR